MTAWADRLLAAPLPHTPVRRSPSTAAAVVLAAGEGRRLRPVTEQLAKPLAPVLNVPLLYWNLAALDSGGFGPIVVNTWAKAEQVEEAARTLRRRGDQAPVLVREATLTGPAGGLAACRTALPDDRCCVVFSGDALTDLPPAELAEAHLASGADLTILATSVPDPHRFGVLSLSGDTVLGLQEKPASPPPDAMVSCGIYAVGPRAFRLLNPRPGHPYDFKDLVPELLAAGLRVRVHRLTGFWNDVGTTEALREANLWALRAVPDRVATQRQRDGLWIQGTPRLADGLRAAEALVGDAASIGPGVTLRRCVVGPGARIGAGATVVDSVLLPGARVPDGRHIEAETVL
ncbi:sugar phosphate nucleotidyltransferase [Kitasatospora sp. NPDC089509]|uniref:sugar phosphate nucleotidyltransferase n=1 Tax=Kitasatospora sp. NPDC089509 TaxID=3364079 RepID=UPI0038196AC2